MKIPLLRRVAASLCIIALFAGWGQIGHKLINTKSVSAFPSAMYVFQNWGGVLGDHASDADYRKDTDPNEGPRHYIDIDEYPEFVSTGRISHSMDSVILQHGQAFVIDQGILPWTIVSTTDSLRKLFQQRNWVKAQLTAADLGHYVGDGHMPLHITRNYNGQYSGQTGVHSRYESSMISKFQSQLVFTPQQGAFVPNVTEFTFAFLYENYRYVDSVLKADSASTAATGSTSSSAYYNKLWEFTAPFTIRLMSNAATRLSSLIYTAWLNAGSPDPTTFAETFGIVPSQYDLALKSFPNPFNNSTILHFALPANGAPHKAALTVFDQQGKIVFANSDIAANPGENTVRFNPDGLASGIYFARLSAAGASGVAKLLLLK